jgi:hypothetical protein
MQEELDAYEGRCHGVDCDKRVDCQRYQERDNLMPWTPIALNICKLEGVHWYVPIAPKADSKKHISAAL